MIVLALSISYMATVGILADDVAAPPENSDRFIVIKGTSYEIYPPEQLRARGIEVPDVPRDQNAAFAYIEAINLLGDSPQDIAEDLSEAAHGHWPDGERGEKLSAYLDQIQPVLDRVRAASTMPEYHLPLFRGDTDSLFAALLPTLGDQRQMARLLAANAHRSAAAGDYQKAFDDLLATQRMGHQLTHGITLIEGLVGLAVGQLSSEQLTQLADTHDVDPAVLRETIDAMDAIAADMPTFDDLIRGEESFGRSLVDDLIEDPRHFAMFSGPAIGPDLVKIDRDNGWNKLFTALRRVYLPDRAMKRHSKRFFDSVRESTKPKAGEAGAIIDEAKLIGEVPAWDVMTRTTLPSLARIYELNLRYQSNHQRAIFRLAVEAYRKEHGSLPPSLEALAPAYVAHVPVDPMTGYDFEYQPQLLESGAPTGLDRVTSENEEALRKKRRTPAILTPRASKWRRFTMDYVDRHGLTDAQRNAAEAILRDVEAKAARFEQSHGGKIQDLIDDGETEKARSEMGPLDKLYDELKRRLDRLPTAKQRALADSKSEGK